MIDLTQVPTDPGCYLYKDKSGTIIYVGKAKNLKKRVTSYFQKRDHDPKTTQLVLHIDSMDFIVTDSEIEALLLENTLIKKHRPKYNIDLKDSKRYAYIKLTDEKFSRLIIARSKDDKKGEFFGPFVSARERDYILQTLRKLFQIRTCKRMPKRACLRYHINLCSAPCIDAISEEDYNSRLRDARVILKGKTKDLIKKLETQMKTYSSNQQFEDAMESRNKIQALEGLSEHQNMERSREFNEDILNYIVRDGRVYLALFNIYKGTLNNKSEFTFDYIDGFFEDFIKQYYGVNEVPKEVLIPVAVDAEIAAYLSKKRGSNVAVNIPKIGERKKLLDLVQKNIELSFFGNVEKLEELRKNLKLNETPHVIECFDISHLSGTHTVASMVQFRNGKPDKSNYRRFKIKTVEGIDDFRSMREVIQRRYTRLQKENLEMPNLIVVDGGKGQLSFSVEQIWELGLRIPIVSLAKREEEVFVPGLKKPIIIDKKSKSLQLLQEIRDEAHRFAISYNRLLRSKKLKEQFEE